LNTGSFNTLTVVATNALSYQWYSNTTNSNTGGAIISTATSSSYTPPNNPAGSLYYYCVITGGCGIEIASDVSGKHIVNPLPSNWTTIGDKEYCPSDPVAIIFSGTNVDESKCAWVATGDAIAIG
jgi:hypothetical protein